jgi:hypothetical protein
MVCNHLKRITSEDIKKNTYESDFDINYYNNIFIL